MAVAPVVKYYRLKWDSTVGSAGGFAFVDDTTDSTSLDFGIVDAGDMTYQEDADISAASLNEASRCQVFAIFNNKGATTAGSEVSDMQNAYLSVVDKNGGSGTAENPFYIGNQKWIQVLMNSEKQSDGWFSLGVYSGGDIQEDVRVNGDYTVGDPETGTNAGKKELHAVAYDDTPEKVGIISGGLNDGTLNNATNNYAQIKLFVGIPQNAPAGAHKFRIRTTYSYT